MDRSTLTPRERAVIEAVATVGQLIKAKKEIRSGELYALVMGVFSLENYERVIDKLVEARLVRRGSHHLLEWIGP